MKGSGMSRSTMLLSFCIFMLSFTLVQAQHGQLGPQDLRGQFESTFVALKWSPPKSDSALMFYNVYRSAGFHRSPAGPNMPPPNAPAVIGTTTDTTYNDSTIAPNTFYFYAVTAVYSDSVQSMPSNFITIYTGTGGFDTSVVKIIFTSIPPDSGLVGQLYDYTPTDSTNPPGEKVCFSLGDAPRDMTINDSTGEVQWTPAYPGVYKVDIQARICDGHIGKAEQKFDVRVFSGKPGSVVGLVTNDSGTGLQNVNIKLFGLSHGDFVLRTTTDSTGHYTFPLVNPAIYFVRADPGGKYYLPQWYNGASRFQDATPVQVPESTTVTVNFTIHHKDTTRYTLSGTVSDSGSNPIAKAKVTIYFLDQDTTDNAQFDKGDCRDNGDRDVAGEVSTDSSGNYSVRLHHGTYILSAHKEGYLLQFWNQKFSPLEADQLQLGSDISGINFTLLHRTQYAGSISGVIRSAQDSSTLHSHVIGFRQDSLGHWTGFTASTRSDSTGQYTLDHLPNGNYIVLAYAGENYIPTFYNLTGGTPFLDSSTAVGVSGGAVMGVDIYLPSDSADGMNSISGVVTSVLPGSTAHVNSAIPLAGVIVTVTNSSNAAVGSAITQSDGSYSVAGVAPGTYNTIFQLPGYVSSSSQVSMAYMNTTPVTASVNAQMVNSSGRQLGTMSVNSNWNLVSLPVTVTDAHLSNLFPTASSNAFGFDASGGQYNTSSMLAYGAGYWVRFTAPQFISLSGTARSTETVTLYPGWNLVGSVSTSVPVSSITSSPVNVLSSDFFGYSNGYVIASSVDPGMGYWIKASSGGTISISSSAAVPSSTVKTASISQQLNSMTIRDAAGNSQVLYFGDKSSVDQSKSYEMPPTGPDGSFDVRFASQKYAALHSSSLTSPVVFPVQIRSAAAGSLTISWSVRNSSVRYNLADVNGKLLTSSPMTGSSSMKVASSTLTGLQLIASASGLPKEYALHQNYPNPFNPSTTIAFDLPATAVVSLKVYNILGQEVSTILDGVRFEGGEHTTRFDASELPSGMYFYQLRAGSFTATKKLVLIK
jgi:protocatechuate 3,4-dioxygenase beta subunit